MKKFRKFLDNQNYFLSKKQGRRWEGVWGNGPFSDDEQNKNKNKTKKKQKINKNKNKKQNKTKQNKTKQKQKQNSWKLKYLADENGRGYTRMGEETLDPAVQTQGDTKEGYYLGR